METVSGLGSQRARSVAQVAQEAQVSQNTIRRGIREVEAGEGYTPGQRQRAEGGGRKKESEKDPHCSRIWKDSWSPKAIR